MQQRILSWNKWCLMYCNEVMIVAQGSPEDLIWVASSFALPYYKLRPVGGVVWIDRCVAQTLKWCEWTPRTSRKITWVGECRQSSDCAVIKPIITPTPPSIIPSLCCSICLPPFWYKLYLKSTPLFNLKKYIFLHFILFTLIMSTSLFVILKQLFLPYCSFTPTYD